MTRTSRRARRSAAARTGLRGGLATTPAAMFRLLAAASVLALASLGLTAVPASAGPIVDPSTLQPPPPPGAECQAAGQWIICQTVFVIDSVNEPILDFALPCGTIYETIHDDRFGIRWYNADGELVKRFVSQDAQGTWSLSPTGVEPTVTITAHANWGEVYTVPGDESSFVGSLQGDAFTVRAPGYGVIAHIAGLELSDGSHRGDMRFIEDPDVAAELCAALGT